MKRKSFKLNIQGLEMEYGEVMGLYGKPLILDVKLYPDQVKQILDVLDNSGAYYLSIDEIKKLDK